MMRWHVIDQDLPGNPIQPSRNQPKAVGTAVSGSGVTNTGGNAAKAGAGAEGAALAGGAPASASVTAGAASADSGTGAELTVSLLISWLMSMFTLTGACLGCGGLGGVVGHGVTKKVVVSNTVVVLVVVVVEVVVVDVVVVTTRGMSVVGNKRFHGGVVVNNGCAFPD